MSKYLIIIPTYNEFGNIIPLVNGIFNNIDNSHVLFVDDNSCDGTKKEISTMQNIYPQRVYLLSRAQKLGLGSAYVSGFRWALLRNYDAMIEMDADYSHDPKYLPKMFSLLASHDVVVGSRYIKGGCIKNWGWCRRLISQGGSWYARKILGIKLQDVTGGFNGWRRHVLETINIDNIVSDGYTFQVELKYRAISEGFNSYEFPITFVDRRCGHSKMSFKIIFEAIWKIWLLRFIKTRAVTQ